MSQIRNENLQAINALLKRKPKPLEAPVTPKPTPRHGVPVYASLKAKSWASRGVHVVSEAQDKAERGNEVFI